ncbi:MAG: Lrp/AsnC family transcriptional regulator [Defluviitaleaceae bacterium]|nr:Lrp/AsnC family transcriptional regulator [Defluviitaleaceae bacterium]
MAREFLSDLDKQIISILIEDASITNLELSKRVGISPSTCLTRTNRLKEDGVIKQIVAVIDEEAVGMEFMAFTEVTLTPPTRKTAEKFVKHINPLSNVLECYNISGDSDFLLKVVAKNASEFRNFVLDELMSLEGIGKISTSVVLCVEKCKFSFSEFKKDT